MPTPEEQFNTLTEQMAEAHPKVGPGKMMSSPAIQYNGKVFAFFYKEAMTFKLGKDCDARQQFDLQKIAHLSPFKNKPPMTAWFIVEADESEKWPMLAEYAMEQMVK